MRKPSNFQLTSDYMSIAEYDSTVLSFVIPAGNISGPNYDHNFDFAMAAQQGAIDRIQVQIGDTVTVDSAPYFSIANANNNVMGNLSCYRTSETNFRVRVYIYGSDGPDLTWSATPVKVYVNSFKPPNQMF